MATHQSQNKFFDFLQHAEHSGKTFSREELIAASGWKNSTFETYYRKGQITQFVVETDNATFRATNTLDLNRPGFRRHFFAS